MLRDVGRSARSSTRNQPSRSHCNIEEIKGLVDKLRRKRSTINELMKNAEDKQFTDSFVKEWLVDLKHTIYDANSLLDRIDTVASHAAKQDNPSKIKEITKKLEEFAEEGKLLGLISRDEKDKDLDGQVCDGRITTSSWDDFDAVCARNAAEDQIMNLVLSSPEKDKVDVIAIVGMGGLGKTTLAKFVYHHPDVEGKFMMRSWACVSDRFDLAHVTRSILEDLTERPAPGFRSLAGLQQYLKKKLRRKRFLIVLDDVWQRSSEKWQKLMAPFNVGAPGSKVIVTTREWFVVSKVVIANYTYELKPMSKEEGLSLFSKVVTANHDISLSPEKEDIGKKIVMKCGGLPLAIKTLGCLLRSDDYESEWENISHSSLWQLLEGQNDIVSALRLSYSNLPPHLKSCFAYCALFPQGHEFSEEVLVNLWIDEGFLQQQCDDKDIKKDELIKMVAKSCFNDLRSYFTQPYSDVYVMHDVMHDLARLLYKDFHLQLEGGRTLKDCEKVRHVSFHSRECNGCIDDVGLGEMMCLQTFLAHRMHPEWSLEDNILRELLLQQPPLRVLCLRGSSVSTLPDEIGKLELLRCLDVSYTVVNILPDSLFELHNLRRLLCDGCDSLYAFHYKMSGLHSLRRFTLSGKHLRETPQYLCQLRDCSVRLVFSLPLDVAMARANVSGSGRQVATDCDGSLLYVEVHINKSDFSYAIQNYDHFTRGDHSNLLESLRPHKDSKKVSIEHFNGRFPAWVVDQSYNNIHVVELSHCRLSSGSMPPLGQMPSLKSLSIRDIANMKILGREFYDCKDPFRFLEELFFEDMKDWEEWEQSDDVVGGICFFRRLRNLRLVNCPSLNGRLPAQLPSLTELSIDGCSNLVTSCLDDKRFFKFSSLQRLVLAGCDSVERFPAEGSLPPSLTSFQIMRFTELNRLGLQNLTSLESLNISHCPKLEALSVERLTRTSKDLHLYDNHPNLVEQCQRDYSSAWNIRTH